MTEHTSAADMRSAWQPIQDTLTLFRSECFGLGQFVDDLFDELEKLRADVHQRTRDLEHERSKLEDEKQLLDQYHGETSRIAQQFAQQETQMAQALEQLEALMQRVEKAPAESQPAQANGDVAVLQQERAELEVELELVRQRAAELAETVESQQHELIAQREETTRELRSLRELIEQQAALISNLLVGANHHSTPQDRRSERSDPATVAPSRSDPVVSSVMAQFAKLQKDVAQRRVKDVANT